MKITILGNCATQTLDHETTSFVVSNVDKHILIDCGPAVVKQLLKANIPLQSISAIVLTHCHGDHIAGYPYLLFMINLARIMSKPCSENKIPVIAIPSLLDTLNNMVLMQYPVEQLSERLIEKYPLQNNGNDIVDILGFSISTFSTDHVVPSVGFSIKIGNKSVTFSGDTKASDAVAKNAKGSSVLVHESFCTENFSEMAKNAGHSTAREAGVAAKSSGVNTLLLCHPLDFMWTSPANLINEARSEFTGEVLLLNELESFEV